ncbi:unnamed protein product [Onchocerca flexuosa]|uniref:2-amino-4-hydroxy-6-hydroxymethyldihydropteridine diphosphokinase n=1 Tax=Onchocerca flexuosa TaxID=387005 RepID=A0A183HVM3_9BILA|nr:unnamed protein product [Onchocerca flexuosa]
MPKMHRQNCIHRRNRYIRKPFDIDVLLGYDKENSFEQVNKCKIFQLFQLLSLIVLFNSFLKD